MSDSDKKIRELEHQIQVLTEENSQLTERAEDSLLLSLISENILASDNINEVFNVALEQISILKGIPFATCALIVDNQAVKIASYSSFSDEPDCGYPIHLSDEILSDLRFGPSIPSHSGDVCYNFQDSSFTPETFALIPFTAQQFPDAVFIFIDNNPEPDRLPPMLMLLNHVVDMVVAKHDNLYLLDALKSANRELEERVKERTRELTESNKALAKSELKYRQLFENVHDAIFVAQDNKIVFANHNTELILDCPRTYIYSTPFIEFIHPRDCQMVVSNYQRRLKGDPDVPSTYSLLAVSRKGREIHIQISSVLVEWNDRPATLNYARDITEQRRMEEALQQSRKMEAIGQLASGVAHDFNNMLGGIIGAAEMLGLYLPDDLDIRKYHRMILESAERAGELTGKLLSFSRNNPQISTTVNIHEIIKETAVLLENTIDPRIEIITRLNAVTSNVAGDPSQLQNIFLNLGINASHAMPEGGSITISTHIKELDSLYCDFSTFDIRPGNYLEIEVHDTGAGIPPEHLSRVFEPFFTTKEQGRGTGLGLASVYGTVQQHRGTITAASKVGEGTAFHLFLPIVDSEAGELQPTQVIHKGSGRILVIDDEEVMRLTAKAQLEELGYQVVLAVHGQDGIDIYKKESETIDLILLDMVMPVMNGRDCFKALKELDPDVRVILSSGFSREADLHEMQSLGLKGFIRKPYRAAMLSQAIYDAMA